MSDHRNLMKHGFIGVGQGGCNILNSGFYKDFPVFAINTAHSDLFGANSLKNIPNDCKYLTRITDGGGAGKEIMLGELAVTKHREEIQKRIETLFKGCEYIWVTVGMGGGSGTLGAIQLVQLLSEMGINHGIIATVPLGYEGTTEKANCVVGLAQLYKASLESDHLKGIQLIDNSRLKDLVMDGSVSYERLWETANAEIYSKFSAMCDFTDQSSLTCLDMEDYKRIFRESGCMVFADAEIDPEGLSENSLALAVMESWSNTIFLSGNVLEGKAVGVVVERPNDIDKDGNMIQQLFVQLKEKFRAGTFCKGVYQSQHSLQETLRMKKKPIRIKMAVSGIPFPLQYLRDLDRVTREEIEVIESKNKQEDLGIDLGSLTGFLQKSTAKPKSEKKIDLTVFNKQEDKVINWNL